MDIGIGLGFFWIALEFVSGKFNGIYEFINWSALPIFGG